ncbi:unnamed protein product [Musa acuminata var. zebrina]
MQRLYRTVHALLGLPHRDDRRRQPSPGHRCRNIPPPYGEGLRVVVGDQPRPPNVLECSAIGRLPNRVDPGARGLHELDRRGGLRFLTEGLGSESCDGGMEAEEMTGNADAWGWRGPPRQRRVAESRRRPPLPPPLPWLAGRRSWFMRAVREGGRIRLTEVWFERPPKILRASRGGGRLRLDLIAESDRKEDDRHVAPGQEEREGATIIADEGEEDPYNVDVEEEEVRAPAVSPEKTVTLTRKGKERRCLMMVSGNGDPTWWSRRPVTTA